MLRSSKLDEVFGRLACISEKRVMQKSFHINAVCWILLEYFKDEVFGSGGEFDVGGELYLFADLS